MDTPMDLVSFVTRAESRVDALLALAAEPRTRRELQGETDIPRATLGRVLADFRERDLATREGHRYRTTPLGDLLAAELGALFESVAAMGTLQTVREWLAIDEFDVPVERLADADVILPAPTDPLAPIRRAEALLAEGSRVRVAAHNMVPGCLAAVWRGVGEGRQTVEIVTTSEALAVASEDPTMAEQSRDLLAADEAALFVHDGDALPALIVVDDVVFMAVSDEAGAIQGHVETTDPTVRAWAEETIDALVDAAGPVADELLTA